MGRARNSKMKYGYARVSTDGQSLDAQVKQLRAAGAEKVFRETASGARAESRIRPDISVFSFHQTAKLPIFGEIGAEARFFKMMKTLSCAKLW